VLPPEVADHLVPQLTAHLVLAIERPSKREERGVLLTETFDVPVVS
jgi:hypothetical protein